MPDREGHKTHFTVPDMSHITGRKKTMRIGFDIDGVLYPWHEEVWKWYVRRNGEPISFIEFWKYPDGWIAKNEGSAVVKAMVKETLPYVSAPANEADVSVMHDITKFFDDIYYITSRPEHLHYDTAQWLRKNDFPFADNLIMADGNGGKVQVVKDAQCNFYVEDRPKYLEILPEITQVFKMTRPYNMYRKFNAITVGSLFEVYDKLQHTFYYFNEFGVD